MAGELGDQKITIVVESRGVTEAEGRFLQAAASAAKLAEQLERLELKKASKRKAGEGMVEKGVSDAKKLGTALESVAKKESVIGGLISSAGASIGKLFDPVRIVSDLAARGVSSLVGHLGSMVERGVQIGVAYERATSRVQGLVQGLVDFGGAGTFERVQRAHGMSLELVRRYKEIAVEAALPYEKIELAAARINPTLSGLGRTQQDVLDLTRATAAAASVYGEDVGEAAKIASKAIFTGTVEGESAFAMAFKQMAAVTSKMSPEERIKRINRVLAEMGGPMAAVTTGTESQYIRWKQLSEDVLQRVTAPIYDRIGKSIERGVGWLKESEDTIDAIGGKTAAWVARMDSIAISAEKIVGPFKFLERIGGDGMIFKILDGAAQSIDLVLASGSAIVDLFTDLVSDGPMSRWEESSLRVSILFDEIGAKIKEIAFDLATMSLPRRWKEIVGEKTSGWFSAKGAAAEAEKTAMDARRARLRELELARGAGPTTASTAALAELEKSKAKQAAEDIRDRKGEISLTQNIGKVEVHNDLRGENPDLIVEFGRDLEKLGERAYQALLGSASVYGPGG